MSSLVQMKSFVVSSLGATDILTPRSPNGKLMIYSVLYNVESDVTGEIKIKLGSEVKSGARNPKTGALYGFNNHPGFMLGAPGDKLSVVLPGTIATTLDVTWREAPDYSTE